MSTDTDTWLGRLWRRLESRYDAGTSGCGCDGSGDAARALERSRLTREDLAAYRRDEVTMAELTAKTDADLDPAAIDDLGGLAAELTRVLDAEAGAGE